MEPAENKPFIRETIEEKPRMSFGKKLLLTVFLALVFGVVAAITFVFGKGIAEKYVTTAATETADNNTLFRKYFFVAPIYCTLINYRIYNIFIFLHIYYRKICRI